MTKRIMLTDDEVGLCHMIEAILLDEGYTVDVFSHSPDAVEAFEPGKWDLVISDVKMPVYDGLEVLSRIRAVDADIPVIMMTAFATVEMSIQALRKGAYDILTKPFEPDELLYRVRNALSHNELIHENKNLRNELSEKFNFGKIIGNSPQLKKLLQMVEKIAVRDISVFITGESGTGKELIAQAIHHNSPRKEKKFLAINCGALPESVLESELFGYKKGAFTGATESRQGLLESANGGTLFLDEIGNLPMNVQKTLLRFLQEQQFHRIGDTTPVNVDVRIISATNADLLADVKSGQFREDLYYRVNVVNLHLPPLRERLDDLPLLISRFIKEQNEKFGTQVRGFSTEAMKVVNSYLWPGNIRQLRNVIEASMALEMEDTISLDVLSQFVEVDSQVLTERSVPFCDDYTESLASFEIEYFSCLLKKFRGNVEQAASAAGMNMATVYRKLKKYGLRREDYQ